MAKEFPVVEIDSIELIDNNYIDRNGQKWSAVKLIEATKGLEPFDMPLAAIDISIMPFKVENLDDFVYQVKRTENTSLKYPIILDDQGCIADGWHRVSKAILKGETTIKAIRLQKIPAIDSIEND